MRLFRPGSLPAWLLLTALLAGCGQKGPLYLPKPPASSAVPEQLSPTLRP
ncbi:MAG: lipoprotein [Candidatus Competibacter sp.]|nr:lipoprotein [Candidatus Competibacter sp.]MDG4606515.1 lipoprotein [Candidatus Contendobacter sp.]